MELQGERVVLRQVSPDDAAGLAAILSQPEVARWWPSFDLARVEADLVAPVSDTRVWAIIVEGRLVGAIQAYEEPDPEFRHASLDLFIDSDLRGQGLGPEVIRLLIRDLAARGHHRIVIDPAAANAAAIRAYEKVGFRPIGVMRSYQRMADGTWHDGLLMELLVADLEG